MEWFTNLVSYVLIQDYGQWQQWRTTATLTDNGNIDRQRQQWQAVKPTYRIATQACDQKITPYALLSSYEP